jgi:hypothetical protein
VRIANALKVTVEFLVTGEDAAETIPHFDNQRRRSMLFAFDRLSEHDQKMAIDFVKLLHKNTQQREGQSGPE